MSRAPFPQAIAICLALSPAAAIGDEGAPKDDRGLAFPFFAMATGTQDGKHQSAKSQAEMLKALGYAGMDHMGFGGLPEKLQALDAVGLKLFAIYSGATIDAADKKYDPGLPDALKLLQGRDAVIWLYVLARGFKPSAPEGDPQAVEVLREIADLAAASGLRVALYPHTGFFVERVEDAVRLAKKVGRKNLGATFNLCHFLKVDREENLRARLEEALPHLFLVSLNGADPAGPGWKELIQNLDRGSFDSYRLLVLLRDLGFRGPVALQGYGIGGDVEENLRRSMEAWRKMSERFAGEWIDLTASGLDPWRGKAGGTGEWTVVGKVSKDPKDERKLAGEPGAGAILNGPKGVTVDILTKLEGGDIEAHVEFVVPRGSNSGVYFQGRYEIQVLDSWGKPAEKLYHGDCGGIYERWDDAANKGYEGRAPRANASREPGQWQSFDVIFRAPRWDGSGKKAANARFVRVEHNGVLIHEDVEVTGPTRAAAFPGDEKPLGPLMLQGDHGPVAYRNVRIRPLLGAAPIPKPAAR